MTHISTICFATDFSPTSEKAKEMTKYLQKELGCTVKVVHVFNPAAFEMPAPYYFMSGVTEWVDEHFAGMRERGRRALDELCPELDQADCHFLEGLPGRSIVTFVKEHDVDLVIMGTHGHRGLNKLLIGSVADYVLKHAPCPVLTVKSEE